MRTPSVILTSALISCAALYASPASALSLKDLDPRNLLDPIAKAATGKTTDELVDKALKEIGNGVRDISKEAEKHVAKTLKEIGNAGEDLRILVETGECRGDICIALDTGIKYAEAMVKSTGTSLEKAGERLSEGKILDALWHAAADPYKNMSDNAAEAAARSTILRVVGQVAATAYGGPGGAAAYAAWLAYYATDGDLELTLKAGAIAGATAYAMNAAASDAATTNLFESTVIDEVVQKALISGAIAGAAVALAGGSEHDIQQAVTAGITMSVIRAGYQELTASDLDRENLKASSGEPYCLHATPGTPGLDCLPPDEAYIRKADGSISYDDDGLPEIDVSKLVSTRPHVGMFAKGPDDPFYTLTETSGPMVLVSRISPGMNAMAVGHDIFDAKFNPDTNVVLEMIVRVGTIAPAVVVTYEGTGKRVYEMIDKEIAERGRDRASQPPDAGAAGPAPGQNVVPPPGKSPPASRQESAAEPAPEGGKPPAAEIRNLVCLKDGDFRNTLMEVSLDPKVADGVLRLCSIDRQAGEGWRHLWHAHYDRPSCIRKFNEIAERNLRQGRICRLSIGVRYDDAAVQRPADPAPAQPAIIARQSG